MRMNDRQYKQKSELLKHKRQEYREKNINVLSMNVQEYYKLQVLRKEIFHLDKELKQHDKTLGQFFGKSNY